MYHLLLSQEHETSLAELRSRNTELEFQVADLTRKAKDLADRVSKAEEAQNKMQQVGGERLLALCTVKQCCKVLRREMNAKYGETISEI